MGELSEGSSSGSLLDPLMSAILTELLLALRRNTVRFAGTALVLEEAIVGSRDVTLLEMTIESNSLVARISN